MDELSEGALTVTVRVHDVESVGDAVDEAGFVVVQEVQAAVVHRVECAVVVEVVIEVVADPVLVEVPWGLHCVQAV